MPSFFHCVPLTLSPGSIIEPGNWGRVLNLYDTNNGQINLTVVNEALLEWARRHLAPTKPSRLASVFTLPTLQEAIVFRDKHQRHSIIHEVEPLADNPDRHDGDYELAMTPYGGGIFLRCSIFQVYIGLSRRKRTTRFCSDVLCG
jgi:hypothetical protein